MDDEGPDQAVEDFVLSAPYSADSASYADDYLLNDIGVALRLNSERL